MTYREYQIYMNNRRQIISENKSRRMRRIHEESLPVPPKIEPPKCRVAYDLKGDYIGRLLDDDEIPENSIIKLEPALW